MSKLNVDQKNICALLGDKKSDFVIPDYQRPYAWTEEECQTLWEDIFEFSFPEGKYNQFNNDEEYMDVVKGEELKGIMPILIPECKELVDHPDKLRKLLNEL